MIKIISGYTGPGGSTIAHINLCNLFNSHGLPCELYGPNDYHMDKCVSYNIKSLRVDKDDIVITHYLNLNERPQCKKLILSLHEKDLFDLRTKNTNMYDHIHFLNEEQKKFHNYSKTNFFYCHNVKPDLKEYRGKKENIAGVVGSIDYNKQTHISIKRALEDGFDKIHLYGNITNYEYFRDYVKPLLTDRIKHIGFTEKQKIYDSVKNIYLSSLSECAPLVQDECLVTNVKFNGNKNIPKKDKLMSDDEILNRWKVIIYG